MDIRDFKVGDKVRVKPLIELARVGLNGEKWLVDLIGRELTVMEVHRREEMDAFVVTGSGLVRVAFASRSLEALERVPFEFGSAEHLAANKRLKESLDQNSDDKLTKYAVGDKPIGCPFAVGQYVRALMGGGAVVKNCVYRVRGYEQGGLLVAGSTEIYALDAFANAGDFTAAKRLGSEPGDSISQVQAQFVHGVLDLFGVPAGFDDPLKWLRDWRFAVMKHESKYNDAMVNTLTKLIASETLEAMKRRVDEAEQRAMSLADEAGNAVAVADGSGHTLAARDSELGDALAEQRRLQRENAALKERIRKLERRG